MAAVKRKYIIESCPKCGHQLLKVSADSAEIGSPLITCPSCSTVCRTRMRMEWYHYDMKWMVYARPLIMTVVMIAVAFVLRRPEWAVGSGAFGFIIGLCIVLRDLGRINESKKRMSDPEYVKQLLQHGVINQSEYERLIQ